ncbi:ribosomal protein S7 [Ganoderma leucocontextum]|nr:ribosomal protein S7 [Ganoderma leucocontextum]
MLANVRQAAARVAFRRAVGVRTLTTDPLAADAAKQPSSIPSPALATTPLMASSSSASTSLSNSSASVQPPVIHIPPAEDPLLHLFTSMVMFDGKRQMASRVVTQMLLHIHAFTKAPPLPILRQAIDTAAPLLRCRQFKRAAKQYVFPMPLSERQRARTAIKWIWEAAKNKGGKHVPERLAREVIAVVKGESDVLKKKSDVHKLAVLHRGNIVKPPRVPRSNQG